jgi:hypothetical protein
LEDLKKSNADLSSAVLDARLANLDLLEDSSDDEDFSEVRNSHECDDDRNGDESKNDCDGQHPPPISAVPPSATSPPSVVIDWNSKTNAVLKKECQRRRLAVSGNKDRMVARIIAAEKSPVLSKEPPISAVPPSLHNRTPSSAVVDWNSKTNEILKDECKRCGLAVSGSKPALVARIIAAENCAKAREQDSVLLRELSTEELLALQSLEELVYEFSCRKDDLVEF